MIFFANCKKKKKNYLIDLKHETNKVYESRLNKCSADKTEPWDEEDLRTVLKQLSNNKSSDPEGLANEIF